jgi:YHS domain-containing protein
MILGLWEIGGYYAKNTKKVFFKQEWLIYWLIVILPVFVLFSNFIYAEENDIHSHEQETVTEDESNQVTNNICPVMKGNKTDPNIYSLYQGKKVYFCCLSCKSAFEKNPQKYLIDLPQFQAGMEHSEQEQHNHSNTLNLARLIKPVGILTLALIVLTVLAGLLRRKNPKFLLKWHKRLGIITLVSALIHATLVLLTH